MKTELKYSPDGGYFAYMSKLYRNGYSYLEQVDADVKLFTDSGEKYDHVAEDISNMLVKINAVLGYANTYIDISFDSITVINDKSTEIFPLKLSPISPAVSANVNSLFSALNVTPVICKTRGNVEISTELFLNAVDSYVIQANLGQNVVVGGEMVWSGCLSPIAVAELLADLVSDDTQVVWDKHAIWLTALSCGYKHAELLNMHASNMEPTMTIVSREEHVNFADGQSVLSLKGEYGHKELIWSGDRYPMFVVDQNQWQLSEGNFAAPLVFVNDDRPDISSVSNASMDRLIKSINDVVWQGKVCEVAREDDIVSEPTEISIELPERFTKKLHDVIAEGEYLGYDKRSKIYALFVGELGDYTSKNIHCVEGQIVTKGQLLVSVPRQVSPDEGVVSFKSLNEGIIKVIKSWRYKKLADYWAKVKHFTKKNKVELDINAIKMYCPFVIGTNAEGYLIDADSVKLYAGKQVLVYIENLDKVNLNELFNNDALVQAVVVTNCNYRQLNQLVNHPSVMSGQCDIVLTDELSEYKWQKKDKFINKLLNRYALVRQNYLLFPLNPQSGFHKLIMAKAYSNKVHASNKIAVGDLVKIVSYKYDYQYARIVSISDQIVLVNTGESLVEISLDNIIKYNE